MSQEGEPSPGEPGAMTVNGAGASPRGSSEVSLDPDHLYNVLFVGDSHVGKTSFLYRLHANTFNPHLAATVGRFPLTALLRALYLLVWPPQFPFLCPINCWKSLHVHYCSLKPVTKDQVGPPTYLGAHKQAMVVLLALSGAILMAPVVFLSGLLFVSILWTKLVLLIVKFETFPKFSHQRSWVPLEPSCFICGPTLCLHSMASPSIIYHSGQLYDNKTSPFCVS